MLCLRYIGRYSGLSGELGSFDGVMIRNYDELGILKKLDYKGLVIADASLYAYNDNAFDFYRENMGDVCFMCSNELTLDEIHGLSYTHKALWSSEGYDHCKLYSRQLHERLCLKEDVPECPDG